MNEYHIVRIEKAVEGIAGPAMQPEDPRRVRYYVRAESVTEAEAKMAERFPNETRFYIVRVVQNVVPLFKELKEAA
jgi:hypothetical protein